MEQLQKYFLSISTLLLVCSCGNKYDDLSSLERKQKSMELFQKEFVKDHHGPLQGSPEKMTLLDEIIALDSTNCDALRELSVAYLKRGIPHEWKPRFDKAVACNPKIWQPWRGYLYLWFYRDYKKAIDDFNASDTLTPDFIDIPQGHSVDYWRGVAYLGLKDYQNSIHYFNKHIAQVTKESGEDWVEPLAFLYLGIVHYENSEIEKSEYNIDKALQYYKNISADSHYYKALLQVHREEYDKAMISIETAIQNYNDGYYCKRIYVEEIRQIYPEQLKALKDTLLIQISKKKL